MELWAMVGIITHNRQKPFFVMFLVSRHVTILRLFSWFPSLRTNFHLTTCTQTFICKNPSGISSFFVSRRWIFISALCKGKSLIHFYNCSWTSISPKTKKNKKRFLDFFNEYSILLVSTILEDISFTGGHPSKPTASKRFVIVMHPWSKPHCIFWTKGITFLSIYVI